ncbi:MAG: hypothetical protein KF843_05465 [Flavobacteriales bacterium]|nr:hypothetical protein [Flavobacteriales bacterium]
MNFQPHTKRTLIHAVVIAAALCLSAYANAQDVVVCKGQVLRDEASTTPISLVIINGSDTVSVVIADNGSFSFVAPAGQELWVRFGTDGRTAGEVMFAGQEVGQDHAPVAARSAFLVELQRSTSEEMPSTVFVSGSFSRTAQVDTATKGTFLPGYGSSVPASASASR